MALNQLLNQFLGAQQPAADQAEQQSSVSQVDDRGDVLSGLLPNGIPGGLVGGLAAGGLLGAVIGNKKMRKSATKMAGGAIGLGGAAALGLVAYKAYQSWQSGNDAPPPAGATPGSGGGTTQGLTPNTSQSRGSTTPHLSSAPAPMQSWDGAKPPVAISTAAAAVDEQAFDPLIQTATDGTPFQAVLLKAMIAAANADGHIDDTERQSIFDAVGKMDLEAEDKAMIFDMLMNPPDVETISKLSRGMEQASEIYLVSRLAIDPDEPCEQAYLQNLASRLQLPNDLVIQLENQLIAAQPAVA